MTKDNIQGSDSISERDSLRERLRMTRKLNNNSANDEELEKGGVYGINSDGTVFISTEEGLEIGVAQINKKGKLISLEGRRYVEDSFVYNKILIWVVIVVLALSSILVTFMLNEKPSTYARVQRNNDKIRVLNCIETSISNIRTDVNELERKLNMKCKNLGYDRYSKSVLDRINTNCAECN